ncbi:hypothetical protein F443_15024 [Phytophthora nicotianae P1569]|uniref:Uncharacterized protein n=2 Tax=Phytophthora nicotianae P1569 TaxID=1317065 RepID=V9ELM9_PHYNI|nr:hypothetical protein F443_15024 [Phytophthora nicotianae P1569]
MMVLDDTPNEHHPLKTNVQQHAQLPSVSGPRQLRLQRQRGATFVAFVGFGLASWILTNVTYVELGVFLRELPEHYSIYAYSILALESANLYPLLYMLFNAQQQLLSQSTVIWWILVQGVVVAVLMSMLWGQTASIFGARHSVAMLVLTHFGGMVSTTSSVVFYPFVASFPPLFTSALATGEGLSGSLAALLGIVQDPGGELGFSVSVFYLICATIMCVSLVAFTFLQYHPWAQEAKTSDEAVDLGRDLDSDEREAEEDTLLTHSSCGSCPRTASASTVTIPSPTASQYEAVSGAEVLRQVWQLLACQWILAAFSFGWLPSTMPYVYKKFSPTDDAEAATARFQTTASIAALILSPLASASTTWFRLYYVRSMTLVLVILAVRRILELRAATCLINALSLSTTTTFQLLLLSFSLTSRPTLSNYGHGYLLPLLVHIFYLVGCAYTQTMLYLTLKRRGDIMRSPDFARRVYQWNGLATQVGAMSGTAVAFPLVFWCESLFTT